MRPAGLEPQKFPAARCPSSVRMNDFALAHSPKPLPSYVVVTQQERFALARTPRQYERQIFLPPIKVHPENGSHVH
jgi:hypothetical protein